jgi:hypothetical protein
MLTKDQIRDTIKQFVPMSLQDNPFVNSLLAGAATVTILLALPAFAPVGVVGAVGWVIVYVVTGGTFSLAVVQKICHSWQKAKEDERERIDRKLTDLKNAKDKGIISEEEYKQRSKVILDELLKI